MKKILAFLLSLLVFPLSFGADLGVIYDSATTEAERITLLRDLQNADTPIPQEFWTEALRQLLSRQVGRGEPTVQGQKHQLAQMILQAMGENPPAKAVPLFWMLYQEATDPVLRGQALVAAAATKDPAAAQKISQILQRFNTSPQRFRAEEIMAWYAVKALGNLKDPVGLEALFNASRGWYSPGSGVKTEAGKALELLEGDLAQGITELITWTLEFSTKLELLSMVEKATFDGDKKAKAALAALEQGLKWQPANDEDAAVLLELRIRSLGLLLALEDKSPEAVGPVSRSLETRASWDQESMAIRVLGNNGSSEAVKVLEENLRRLNQRSKAGGLSPQDLNRARLYIAALGDSKNPGAKQVLSEVEYSDYTPAVIRDAQEARRMIP